MRIDLKESEAEADARAVNTNPVILELMTLSGDELREFIRGKLETQEGQEELVESLALAVSRLLRSPLGKE